MKKINCNNCNFTKDIMQTKTSVWLFGVCAFLLGIIVGFSFAPIRKGINIGNNNKAFDNDHCTVNYIGEDDENEYEEQE